MTLGDAFGIDIGTRTTVIFRWDSKQREATPVKLGGDAIVPSSFIRLHDETLLGSKAEEYVEEEPSRSQDLAKGFKIRFWVRDGLSTAEIDRARFDLSTFLVLLWERLHAEFSDTAESAKFCFTYPAQRGEHQDEFEQLVLSSGFPKGNIQFLDEPMAAALGFYAESEHAALAGDEDGKSWVVRALNAVFSGRANKRSKKKEQAGTVGCIVDIGAGTTDISIVEVQQEALNVLANRSIDVAGNHCTERLAALATGCSPKPAKDPLAAWIAFARAEPSQADNYKENYFSNHYRKKANRPHPQLLTVARYGVQLSSENFGDLETATTESWEHVERAVGQAIHDAGVKAVDGHLLVGGGARHSALVSLARKSWGANVVLAKSPQFLVAVGAMRHCGGADASRRKKLLVTQAVKDRVAVLFPTACAQAPVVLFEPGDQIDMGKSEIQLKRRINLKSNVVFAEGECFLRQYQAGGSLPLSSKRIGEIDINWDLFGESDDHAGEVLATLKPDSGLLGVAVTLKNVGLHSTVVGRATIRLGVRGGFEHVE